MIRITADRTRAARRLAAGSVLAVVLFLLAGVPHPGLLPGASLPVASGPAAVRGADPAPTLPPAAVRWYQVAADGTVRVELYFGWTSTCPHCAKARAYLPQLVADDPWIDLHSYQLDGDNAQNLAFVNAMADSLGMTIQGVPVFFYGGHSTVGFDEGRVDGAQLQRALIGYRDQVAAAIAAGGSPAPGASAGPIVVDGGVSCSADTTAASCTTEDKVDLPIVGSVAVASLSLPVVTLVLAGLDSVNPCSLSVLFFLLSLLVGMRSRPRMLLVGGTYVFISGLAYFLFMAAWLNLFLLVGVLRIVTLVAGVLAVTAALINIKDFIWFRRGVSLVMPDSAKPRIFGRMIDFTGRTELSAMLAGTVVVAAAANLYEAICTGGFPVVFTRILTLSHLSVPEYYLWLLLYNLVYVAPLLVVVILFTFTLGSHTVTKVEARRLKLLSGLLMLSLGVLLVFAPERLGDATATIIVFAGAVIGWAIIVLIDRARRPRLPAIGTTPGT